MQSERPAGIFPSAIATATQLDNLLQVPVSAALDRHLQFPGHPQSAYSRVSIALAQPLLPLSRVQHLLSLLLLLGLLTTSLSLPLFCLGLLRQTVSGLLVKLAPQQSGVIF